MNIQLSGRRVAALMLGLAVMLLTGLANADPPARVVRLGHTEGAVSFSPAGENDWVQATLNRPLVAGDRLWVDNGARAELQAGQMMLRLGSATSINIINVDDRTVQLQLAQGALDMHVRRIDSGQVLEVDTPNLAYAIRRSGDYRVDVDPAGTATTVAARAGQAEVFGEGAAYAVDAGHAYRFVGTGLRDYESVNVAQQDDLDRWAYDRDKRFEASVSARYVSPDVVGYQDLDAYGAWRTEPGYGNVWVPSRVGVGWAPYRDGHWAWVEPWGWTWIDAAPWGFAVSHYGRWASVRGAWCWVPGPVAAPAVYAPALVAFVGGSNFGVTIAAGGVGAIGWFPLAPREVYVPAYPVSRAYFTNVNVTNTVVNVTNVTNVYNTRNFADMRYANQRVPNAIVAVPTTAFAQAQPVSRSALRLSRDHTANVTISPMAAVAPLPASVRGGAAAAGHVPPARVLDRRVIATNAPPAPPPPFAAKQLLLAENPGRPLDRTAVNSLKTGAPAQASRVQLVNAAPRAGAVSAPPVQPPHERGKTPMAAAQPGMPPAPPQERGKTPMAGTAQPGMPPAPPQQRGKTPMAGVAQPGKPEASPRDRSATTLANVQPGIIPTPPNERGQAATAAPRPPDGAVMPPPAANDRHAKPAERGAPPNASPNAMPPRVANVQPPAPAPAPQALEHRSKPQERGPATANVAPRVAAPPPSAPAPQHQRAQPEPRGKPESAPVARAAPAAAPPARAAPAPMARQVEPRPAPAPSIAHAPPEPRGPAGRPQGGKPDKNDGKPQGDDDNKKHK